MHRLGGSVGLAFLQPLGKHTYSHFPSDLSSRRNRSQVARKRWNAASVEDSVECRHHVTEIDRSVVGGLRRIETTRVWPTVEQPVKCGAGICNIDDAIRV